MEIKGEYDAIQGDFERVLRNIIHNWYLKNAQNNDLPNLIKMDDPLDCFSSPGSLTFF